MVQKWYIRKINPQDLFQHNGLGVPSCSENLYQDIAISVVNIPSIAVIETIQTFFYYQIFSPLL